MRFLLPILALGGIAFQSLRGRREAANVRRLATELDCSLEDATLLYRLAREIGYGAAHEHVFGRRETVAARARASHDDTRDQPQPEHASPSTEGERAALPSA